MSGETSWVNTWFGNKTYKKKERRESHRVDIKSFNEYTLDMGIKEANNKIDGATEDAYVLCRICCLQILEWRENQRENILSAVSIYSLSSNQNISI